MDERQQSYLAAHLYDALGGRWQQRPQFEGAGHRSGFEEITRDCAVTSAPPHTNLDSMDHATLAWLGSGSNGELRGVNPNSRLLGAHVARWARPMTREQIAFLIAAFLLIALLSATITARVIAVAESVGGA